MKVVASIVAIFSVYVLLMVYGINGLYAQPNTLNLGHGVVVQLTSAGTCIMGFDVQEGASPTAGTWVTIGSPPSTANTLNITPATVGNHYYRVSMNLSDGTKVLSNVWTLKVTDPNRPMPPVNLRLVFEVRPPPPAAPKAA